jgi:hypothetical protein
MKITPVIYPAMLLCLGFALRPLPSAALQGQVAQQNQIINLQVGQRIKVDDGTCPAGQIKEIFGAKMAGAGVVREQKCIPRLGPKSNLVRQNMVR